ncbi:MAG: phytoene desaturase [Flavobacterium sp.]|nr:phytoene desaturase [Pedobacter sp.]
MTNAVVVGAGIAGIASAIRLSVKGFNVNVYESNSYPGGKLSNIEGQGFRFDAGPSLFTMPQYVNELFELAGKDPKLSFNAQKLDLVCKYFYQDGTIINAWADQEKFASEIEAKTSDTAKSVRIFLNKSRLIYKITHHIFLEKSLNLVSSYLNFNILKSVLSFLSIDPFRTMNSANQGFFRDNKTIQLFNRYATYNGSDPFQAPATLNVISHLEHHYGAFFPVNGMYSITTALVKLAEELGVKFHYNSLVEEVVVERGKVKGLRIKNKFVHAEVVVSNMDIWFTYKKLLPNLSMPKRILVQERSSSALIFYWGISKKFKELHLHNIFFSENYREEFRHIWKEKDICSDPTIYLNISSKYKPDDAPKGSENWFVMINVPANEGQDWNTLVAEARKNILRKLSEKIGHDISELIVFEEILDPRKIESKTSSYRGSIYGTSSNNRFAAFLRHSNFSNKIKNLFFVGGSVHPGGGIPLALLSAKIVDGLLPKNQK